MQRQDAQIFPMNEIEKEVAQGRTLREAELGEMLKYARGDCPMCHGRGYEVRDIDGQREYFPCTYHKCAFSKIKKHWVEDFIVLKKESDIDRERMRGITDKMRNIEDAINNGDM